MSEARKREFWENLAAKPMKYSEYELTDEHIRSLQSSRGLPEATPMRRAHFDAWLAEHDRRVREDAWDAGYIAGAEDTNSDHFSTDLDDALGTPNPYNKDSDA